MNEETQKKEDIIRRWAQQHAGAAYVYGGTGARCTTEYRNARIAQYPDRKAAITAACDVLAGRKDSCRGCRYEGKACFDCAQFTRRALEAAGIAIPSGASSQWRSDSWAHKGPIAGMPRDRLCVVYRESGDSARPMAHTGLYLGNGQAMDARGHMQGVLTYPVAAYPWTHYAIPYGLAGAETNLAKGAAGGHVRAMQQLLLACGYPLPRHGADGVFGQETAQALNTFQRDNGLPVTEAADSAVLSLLADMAAKTAPDQTYPLEQRVWALEEALKRCPTCASGVTG